jgi:hypothetical protein
VGLEIELLEERRFASGVLHLHYRARRPSFIDSDQTAEI